MTPDIRELDAETRDRIAAGEVVERPASVVKELVENALDADASRVEVAVETGGKDRVVVSDDGLGMTEAEVRKAVREHTTSKLRAVDDLEAIGTLGFRGEALHAIGSVARLAVRTRSRGGSRGTELVVEGGEIVDCGPTGCPEGTTVEVTDLFGNVPARRKYLKTDATEFDRVQRVVAAYALGTPEVAVALEHDGREAFATPGDGDRRSAVLEVYGREVAASMIPVDGNVDADADADADADVDADADEYVATHAEGPLASVEGLVSHPETNRSGAEYVTTLVNGRYVTANVVREAIIEAYGSQLAADRYPFAVVDLECPPGAVDVNVHPRKLEVLFVDAAGVRQQVREAVEAALLEEGLLRSRAPRGRSAPEQTEIPGDSDPAAGSPDSGPDQPSTPSTRSAPPDASQTAGEADDSPDPEREQGASNGSNSLVGSSGESSVSTGTDGRDGVPTGPSGREPVECDGTESVECDGTEPVDRDGPGAEDRQFRERPSQRSLDGAEAIRAPESFGRLPSMDVLGQYDDTYVVAETPDGLVLVDQHAADERVNYERLRKAFADDVTTQTLAEPVELELTAREAALVDAHGEALARLGFRLRREGRTAAVTTVPALLAERVGEAAPELARDLVGDLVDDDPAGTVEAVVDDLLGDLACHPSIRANTSLREGTVVELLAALDDCENPYACPHGRPTVIELSREEIEDRFERDYPGHGDRRA